MTQKPSWQGIFSECEKSWQAWGLWHSRDLLQHWGWGTSNMLLAGTQCQAPALLTDSSRKCTCPQETPLAWHQGKQSCAAPGRVLHRPGKGSCYAHNADSWPWGISGIFCCRQTAKVLGLLLNYTTGHSLTYTQTQKAALVQLLGLSGNTPGV